MEAEAKKPKLIDFRLKWTWSSRSKGVMECCKYSLYSIPPLTPPLPFGVVRIRSADAGSADQPANHFLGGRVSAPCTTFLRRNWNEIESNERTARLLARRAPGRRPGPGRPGRS